jgi:hypothetical protein
MVKVCNQKHRRKIFYPFLFCFWYWTCRQIWLNSLVNHCHFDYITKKKHLPWSVCVMGVVGAMVVQEYLLLYTLCQMVCMFWWLFFWCIHMSFKRGFLKERFQSWPELSLALSLSLSLCVSGGFVNQESLSKYMGIIAWIWRRLGSHCFISWRLFSCQVH